MIDYSGDNFKVGDRVRIKSLEDLLKHPEITHDQAHGRFKIGEVWFIEASMSTYCGREFKITELRQHKDDFLVSGHDTGWAWNTKMIEYPYEKSKEPDYNQTRFNLKMDLNLQ